MSSHNRHRAETAEETKKPVKSLKAWTGAGNIEVAIFAHEKDGRTDYSVTWHKSFKSKSDGWQTTHSLFARELLTLGALLFDAWMYCSIQESGE